MLGYWLCNILDIIAMACIDDNDDAVILHYIITASGIYTGAAVS